MTDRSRHLTRFNYLYRDAGNFKSCGSILLEGKLSAEDQERILARLEDGLFFVAEQLPSLPYMNRYLR
jgi:hypothetical protein